MNEKLKNLLFIVILGSVCTSVLIGIRSYTLPIIERYHDLRLKETIMDAAGIDYEKDELTSAFDKNIKTVTRNNFTYYISPDNLYIFIFEGRGLWGMISGSIALNPDLETLDNIKIISQEETPGLGARIAEEEFLNQFRQKKVSPKLFMAMRKKASEANEIDAVTGASMTSKALIDTINESVINFRHAIH